MSLRKQLIQALKDDGYYWGISSGYFLEDKAGAVVDKQLARFCQKVEGIENPYQYMTWRWEAFAAAIQAVQELLEEEK